MPMSHDESKLDLSTLRQKWPFVRLDLPRLVPMPCFVLTMFDLMTAWQRAVLVVKDKELAKLLLTGQSSLLKSTRETLDRDLTFGVEQRNHGKRRS